MLAVLPAAARDYLEACMTSTTHRHHSDIARRYFDQGEAATATTVHDLFPDD